MKAWLRRNRWYLVALVVLIPGALLVSLVPRFLPYLDGLPRLETVERGDTVRYAGADFELVGLEVLDGPSIDAPPGTDVVVVTLDVEVVEPADGLCTLTLISDESGAEREWDQAYGDVGDFRVLDRFEESCDLAERARYELQQTFVVPHGEVAEPTVQLTAYAEEPRVVRLR